MTKKSNVVQLRPVTKKYVSVPMDIDTYQAIQFLAGLNGETVKQMMIETAKQVALTCPADRVGYLRACGMLV